MNPPSIVSVLGWTTLPTSSEGAGPSVAPSTTSASNSGHNVSRARKRRPEQVYKILTDYFEHQSERPKKQERIQLAEIIRAIPGCEDYSEQDVNQYFTGKRQTRRKKKETETSVLGTSTPADILYPSLRDVRTLQKLDVLLNALPKPTMEVAVIWAQRLGGNVKAADILTYAELRAASASNRPVPSSLPAVPALELPRLQPFHRSTSQLPTPAASTSPEPRTPTSPLIAEKWSPLIKEEDELESDVEPNEMDNDIEETEPLAERKRAQSKLYDSHLHDLAMHLQQALLSETPPPEEPPKTFAELSRWFQQQHAVSASLLDGISQGTYAHLGLGMLPLSLVG